MASAGRSSSFNAERTAAYKLIRMSHYLGAFHEHAPCLNQIVGVISLQPVLNVKLPTSEDLIPFLFKTLKDRLGNGARAQHPGVRTDCDLYAYDIAYSWLLKANPGVSQHQQDFERLKEQLVAIVVEAAWELIRRGGLRPGGLTFPDTNASDPGRFCLTARGREWLATADESHYIIMQSSALRAVFEGLCSRFNEGFAQRSAEAVRCREADAYLACCVMCGAAAESVLLSLAVAKIKDEKKVLNEYLSSGGRGRVINNLVGQEPKPIADDFKKRMVVIAFWRDDAAHGLGSPITAPEADFTLRELLLLAQFATHHWERLTQTAQLLEASP